MPRARITKARIKFISLCPRGANKMPVVYKDDETAEFETLTKASADLGEITAVVYPPEYRDAQGDIASADVIKDMAHAFLKEGGEIDIRHDGKPVSKDRAHLAESFVVAKGDERFADFKDADGKTVDVTGAWATVIKVDDPALREAYRKGEWTGVSMAGPASKQIEKSEDEGMLARLLKAVLSLGHKTPTDPQETDMKPEEIAALVKENVAKALTDAGLTKPTTPAPAADENAPKFEGDLTKAEDIAKFEASLAHYEIRKGLESSDPKVRAAAIAKAKALAAPAAAPVEKSDEVKKLEAEKAAVEARLAKALGASAAPAAGDKPIDTTISKATQDAIAAGERMAKFANAQRGVVAK